MALPPIVRPSAAFADLRAFLATRERYHWVFAALSVVITGYFITIFLIQSWTKEYKPPEVTWVTSYAANRTEAEIKAQQAIDQAKRIAEAAELKKLQEAQRQQAVKLQEQMRGLGL